MRLSVAVVVACTCLASWVGAQESRTNGSGDSYWGSIPTEADTASADFARMRSVDRSRPAWEHALNVPYQIIAIPFRLVGFLVGQTIQFVDQRRIVQSARDLLVIEPVETRLTPIAGGEDGVGLQLSMRDRRPPGPGPRYRFDVAATTRSNSRAFFGGLWRFERNTFEFGGSYFKDGRSRFHGVGPHSRDEDKSFYTREGAWVGTALHRRLFGNLFGSGTVVYSETGTRGASSRSDPNLDDVFRELQPAGFGMRSKGVLAALTLTRNTAPWLGRPDDGVFSRATLHFFESTSADDTRYWAYRLDVQRFLPLWFTKRSLATRASLHRLVSDGNDPIPLPHLLLNEMPDMLRGYVNGRWHDRGMLNLTAEYRWPVWNKSHIDDIGIDAYLFVDYGQVFSETEDISTRNMTTSYGGGLRVIDNSRFFVRLEVGHSKEDTVFRLSADQVFQFSQSGFFYGRDPQ